MSAGKTEPCGTTGAFAGFAAGRRRGGVRVEAFGADEGTTAARFAHLGTGGGQDFGKRVGHFVIGYHVGW